MLSPEAEPRAAGCAAVSFIKVRDSHGRRIESRRVEGLAAPKAQEGQPQVLKTVATEIALIGRGVEEGALISKEALAE